MPRDATAPTRLLSERVACQTPVTRFEESGQTMAEYALITALIAVVVATAITTVGNPAIQALYTKLSDAVP
jgi:Flp pilus assembly pilin Flp